MFQGPVTNSQGIAEDLFGEYKPIYPMDDEHDLKLNYDTEFAVISELEDIDTTKIQVPRWKPDITYGKVSKVYDGDTFTIVAIPQNGDGCMYKFSVRLRDIDTPEIGDVRHATQADLEKALKAKQFLSDLILNKVVKLQDVDTDKYGRVLAHVYVKQENVSRLLLEANLGYEYHGGKKRKSGHT